MTGPSEPPRAPSDLGVDLAAATQLVVEPGGAFDTYPYVEQPDLLVETDPEVVRQVVRELATADLTPGVVLPVLPGLTLTFRDSEGDHLGSVDVLGARWLRSWWSSDALLPEPLSLLRDDNDLHQYLRAGHAGVDAVAPTHAAALDGDGVEHAIAPDDGTLCGLPGTDVVVHRHLFAYLGQDCPDCYRLAWEQNNPPTWPHVLEHAQALSSMWTAGGARHRPPATCCGTRRPGCGSTACRDRSGTPRRRRSTTSSSGGTTPSCTSWRRRQAATRSWC